MSTETQTEDIWEYAEELVREFIVAFDASKDPELWMQLVMEESLELIDAELPAEELKEACDWVYVVSGSSIIVGLDVPLVSPDTRILKLAALKVGFVKQLVGEDIFREAFTRVHQSNMSKLGDDGKPVRRDDGKIMKGPNYKPPYLDDLINKDSN